MKDFQIFFSAPQRFIQTGILGKLQDQYLWIALDVQGEKQILVHAPSPDGDGQLANITKMSEYHVVVYTMVISKMIINGFNVLDEKYFEHCYVFQTKTIS